jgi:phage terminase Nu1 subunit (DNA packaging protein)
MNRSEINSRRHAGADQELLGDPLTIAEVAALLGCSPWTIRQRYLPQGLPYVRATTAGKLVFFRAQIIRWILERQGGHQ